jgi:hypothetical protein
MKKERPESPVFQGIAGKCEENVCKYEVAFNIFIIALTE